mmetsp:Transcript_19441/g.51689  ORF Transcript_19441/g.51689 Transcript_19441/m.51689 type:complete len:153 (-) Transcript_19441:1480-1938(-)
MMVMPGASCGVRASSQEIAMATVRVMLGAVPKEVPGIMFLSGGMSEEDATINLNTLNVLADSGLDEFKVPWVMSFSYGRALQSSVLKIWAEAAGTEREQEGKMAAEESALALYRAASQAQEGRYHGPHPSQIKASLIENFRGIRSGEDPPGV